MPGRIPLESLAGIAWNPWPESNGITGRDHVESVAGIVWNLHVEFFLIGKNSLIICFAGFNQMEHDPCEFVGGSRNCFWGSMPGSHTTEKMAQDRLTLPESLGRKP